MTAAVVLAVIAVTCSVVGCTFVAIDWWRQRHQTGPAGRHRDATDQRANRVRDDRGRDFPRPTREQLRQEAGR